MTKRFKSNEIKQFFTAAASALIESGYDPYAETNDTRENHIVQDLINSTTPLAWDAIIEEAMILAVSVPESNAESKAASKED